MSQAEDKKFLESYGRETVDQLVAMESQYRVDSIVLAFEQALDAKKSKNEGGLTQPELDVLAVEALEREVNNGGFHQFFLNSSEYAAMVPASLRRIGCPITAAIALDAIAYLKINGEITVPKIDSALDELGDQAIEDLVEMDDRFFRYEEPIAERLFAYIKAKKGEIAFE